ncbi:molybdopterin-guanine dinucleotide biosynthesis protein B [Microaerobacter geothermalis]|uniref:molybdopterin-guanine dinucleotide biosynthesis protein B n=1 Tax=Microaerobacter geothermalis TaxID=674972 RepID=UPI001F3D54EE|nr:molybdopterin-guanine dinucleotide biosynthesis protein B [Microaerobacter geothermalis]MCF6092643.1 molybdopterin-guanine dinucleotide biosynthesis protein B [Microaerobacter geothermalis]
MIPVFNLVGYSNSGKTTLICRLIEKFKILGWRVATLKHDVHGFEMDREGKDTWKHRQAGADVVSISSRGNMAILGFRENDWSLGELLSKIEGVDVILVEGYKGSSLPKMVLLRNQEDFVLLHSLQQVKGVVYWEKEGIENIPYPCFHIEQIDAIFNLVYQEVLTQKKMGVEGG